MKKIIAPSILASNFLNLAEEISTLNSIDDLWYHLDIMDAHFVPNLTFGHPVVEQIKNIAKHPLDAHLMVLNPEFYVETFKNFHIHNMTFHIETLKEPMALIKKARPLYKSIGLSLRPSTDDSALTPELLENIDLLLIMSVEPGFAGQKFIETTWKRLDHFQNVKQKKSYHYSIQVDGGVSDKNAKQLFNSGANNLVTGSYLFKQTGKYADAVHKLLL